MGRERMLTTRRLAAAVIGAGLMLAIAVIAWRAPAIKPDADLPAASDKGGQEGEALAGAAAKSLVGRPAPRLVLRTVDGKSIDLAADYGRRPVYLKFWATWCAPCRTQMPHFQKTFAALGGDMEVVAVDTGFNDSIEKVEAYRKLMGLGMPVVVDDGTAAAAFNLRVTPQHVVIGRDGRIVHIGHAADDRLERALAAARRPVDGATVVAAGTGVAPSARPATVTTLTGETLDLRGQSGKARTLIFMSAWCDWYLAETRPKMASDCKAATATLARPGAADGRQILVLSGIWTTAQEARTFVAQNRIGIPTVFDTDGAIFRGYGVRRVPTRLTLAASGEIADRREGAAVSGR